MDSHDREVSQRDQSRVELDLIAGRRLVMEQGGALGNPGCGGCPGSEDPPPLPYAVTQSWGLF